ncbi:MAG: YceI family protein [Deltaproteobacteria bacterium]|nr:YceI family protein [Deltaproteobacteria bacterium]
MRLAAIGLLSLTACKKDADPPAIAETPPPPAASASAKPKQAARYTVTGDGKVAVTIDASLEKFKGETKKLSGTLDVDPNDLAASKGEVVADLDAFATSTFGDADKDETQTEHAKNWFELGEKVEPKKRDDYRMARFTIAKVEETTVKSLANAPEKDGVRVVTLKVAGDLRVHGRNAPKRVRLEIRFKGPADAPTEIAFKTLDPLTASLSEHDVKPRDLAGKFLAGALEKVGKKLDDKASIAVEGHAAPSK